MTEHDEGVAGPRGELLDAVAARAVTGLRLDLGQVRREAGRRRRRRAVLAGGAGLALTAAVLGVVRLNGGPTALPPQLPVASAEVCQEYVPATVAGSATAVTAVVAGRRQELLRLPEGTPAGAAAVAMALAREHTAHCVIGDPATGLQFWKRGTEVVDPPTSARLPGSGTSCTAYDPATVTVSGGAGQWHLLAPPDVLLASTSSAADAVRALLVARQADRLCLVGDPARPLTWYWVRPAG